MPFDGATLIDELARRLRDPDNLGYPRTLVLDVLNHTQRAINARLGLVHATASLTVAGSALYAMTDVGSDVVRVVAVRDEGGRELMRVGWDKLVAQDDRWLRSEGGQPDIFAQIGREILVIAPTPLVPRAVEVVYVKQTGDLVDAAGAPFSELPDEHKALWLDLAEAVLLFRGRQFAEMQAAMRRVAPALGLEDLIAKQRQGEEPRRG